ncbi:MAG: cobyrinate a,c-diamide synthase [Deltaproteobacteria bacterium]|nr:cobyrinate a,c-diamide synthase [Deltaproteobacteria bacterium]
MKSVLIAAPSSGSGKTTISLGIMAALRKRGLVVQPFKVGPDFIDPGHHTAVCGRVSRNLDGWMLTKDYVVESFINACHPHPNPLPSRERENEKADIAVIEGVMGLFDGVNGKSEDGSSAQIAKWTGSPVILVVDARGMARSTAALLSGFENFDKELNIAGVIFNRVGSERHKKMLREAVEANCKAKVLGFIPRDEGLAMPERHLGLVTAEEGFSQEFIERLADVVEKNVDLEGLLEIAERPHPLPDPPLEGEGIYPLHQGEGQGEGGIRIAVARDQAFSFYYEDNFDIIRSLGTELVFFSPLADKKLPEGISGLYLGGGYPEVYAEGLSANHSMLDSIRSFVESGGKVYAECGGFMYLTEGIIDFDGKFHSMVGIYPTRATMLQRRKALGYMEVETVEESPLFEKGSKIRGHEFHYSEIEDMPESVGRAYRVKKPNTDDSWAEGYRYKNTLTSYVHLHFGSNVEWAKRLIFTAEVQRKP